MVGVGAGGWRESDLAFGLREGNTILITKPHWSISLPVSLRVAEPV
jgi:hypothetical protein